MFFSLVFDTKVVDDQGEVDGSCLVGPESGGDVGWRISKGGEDRGKAILCNFSGLRETIHAFAHFGINIAIFDEVGKFVGIDEFLWDHIDADSDVLINFHVVVEVEIFDIHTHVFCIGGGDDTIPMGFDRGDIGGWSADISRVIDEVAPGGEANLVSFFFLWTDITDRFYVCGFAAFGDLASLDEKNRVRSFVLAPSLG